MRRVPREKLWRVLREYSVDSRLFLAVKSTYPCSKICVRIGGVKSQQFTGGVDSDKGVYGHHSSS